MADYAQNSLLIGVLASYFWGFGEMNRGGLLATMVFATGFTRFKDKFGDQTIKSPLSPVIQTGINFGGWVMATQIPDVLRLCWST